MSARVVVELPNGKNVLVGKSSNGTPPFPFAPFMMFSSAAEGTARNGAEPLTGDQMREAFDALSGVVSLLQTSIDGMANRPDEIEVEFGATLTPDSGLWIVPPESQPDFKIKLAWEKD